MTPLYRYVIHVRADDGVSVDGTGDIIHEAIAGTPLPKGVQLVSTANQGRVA